VTAVVRTRSLDASITAVGVAVPEWRVAVADIDSAWGRSPGRGTLAVCRADEDPLTLAWAAADRALTAAGLSVDAIDGMWWGCTRPPFAEGPSWTTLAATLHLDSTVDGALFAGSTHAGVDALLAAVDAVSAGRVHTALVVTSDALLPATGTGHETSAGAGAAAVVLQSDSGPARLVRSAHRWEPRLDRYRGDREAETRETYDGRLFREQAYLPMLGDVGDALVDDGDPAGRWSVPDPDGRLARALLKRLATPGGAAEDVAAGDRSRLGDLGSAAALVGAAAALGTPGPLHLLASGGGRVSGITVIVDRPVPGAEQVAAALAGGEAVTYTRVLRARGVLSPTGESVEMAVPPGSAMFGRGAGEMLGLLAARCVDCGTLNTPPDVHPTCISCGSTKFDIVPLGRTGTVQTFVVNRTMPSPFEAPLPLVVVDLDDGGRIQLQGGDDGADLAVGAPVHLVLRRYAVERGVPVYGWKVLSAHSRQEVTQ